MKVLIFIKKNIISILFVLFVIFLVVFSNSNLLATKNGLNLWANSVVPSLFPFLVASQLLSQTNVVYFLSKYLDRLMRPIFNVPGTAAFPFIMGLISGYPVGAKIVSNLYAEHKCSKDEAERMLCFTNNSGPLFIVGYCGISLYGSSSIGIILLFTHILSSIIVGIILGIISKIKNSRNSSQYTSCYINNSSNQISNNNYIKISELGEIIGNSILSSIKTILVIGGFVTLFSVIISILNRTKILLFVSSAFASIFKINSNLINAFFMGFIEFTNGLAMISNIHLKSISVNLVVSAFILGFGGISVTLQVLSIISKYRLSGRKYVIGKLLHGIIASIITFIVFQIPIFNFNL